MFVMIANFSMLILYVNERKDWLSFLAPTIAYQYFAKQIEACALNSWRVDSTHSGVVMYNEDYKLN